MAAGYFRNLLLAKVRVDAKVRAFYGTYVGPETNVMYEPTNQKEGGVEKMGEERVRRGVEREGYFEIKV